MFEGKSVVITGAGGGIGREIALLVAERGGRVVVNDLGTTIAGEGSSSAPAEETVSMIKELGGEAVVSTDSVSSWEGSQRIIESALDNFGKIDVVVNNAGNLHWSDFWEMEIDEFDSIIRTHLYGTFYVSRAAAPHFKGQSGGVYVHMTSTSGIMGNPRQVHYCAAKAGIVGLSKAITLDMKDYNVRSNCVAPFAYSRMARDLDRTPEHKEVMAKMKPVQSARLVTALASDAASDINAQVFIARGNQIFVAHQGWPAASVHDGSEWSPEGIIEHGFPALKKDFTPTTGFFEYFTWPVT